MIGCLAGILFGLNAALDNRFEEAAGAEKQELDKPRVKQDVSSEGHCSNHGNIFQTYSPWEGGY